MKAKYLVELSEDYSHKVIERFYFDTLEELFEYLNKEKDTLFNCGFNSKEVHLYRIEKGE